MVIAIEPLHRGGGMNIRVVLLRDVKDPGVFKEAFSGVGQPEAQVNADEYLRGGLRVSELVNLRKDDIHIDRMQLFVRGSKGEKDRLVFKSE